LKTREARLARKKTRGKTIKGAIDLTEAAAAVAFRPGASNSKVPELPSAAKKADDQDGLTAVIDGLKSDMGPAPNRRRVKRAPTTRRRTIKFTDMEG
jgi:hypothetical protein